MRGPVEPELKRRTPPGASHSGRAASGRPGGGARPGPTRQEARPGGAARGEHKAGAGAVEQLAPGGLGSGRVERDDDGAGSDEADEERGQVDGVGGEQADPEPGSDRPAPAAREQASSARPRVRGLRAASSHPCAEPGAGAASSALRSPFTPLPPGMRPSTAGPFGSRSCTDVRWGRECPFPRGYPHPAERTSARPPYPPERLVNPLTRPLGRGRRLRIALAGVGRRRAGARGRGHRRVDAGRGARLRTTPSSVCSASRGGQPPST